ncbi:MAG: TonB-dependent receptor [Bacteroidetes bacterium HLUCCA01]|nr:MAG: TonB-dependent receptor [Bacteroidetes bacterium HLUCCA01]
MALLLQIIIYPAPPMKLAVALILVLFSLINETIASDQPVRASVSGIITDSRTGETLINASVVIKGTTTGTVTNASGFYTFSDLRAGNYTFQFTYVGYQPIERDITLVEGERLRLDVSLTPADFMLEEVVVQADQEREEARNIGTARISTQLIKDIPAVLQADVFRSVQLLPGVKAASDFSSGLYIRGGGPDQTLILLDRTTVYNPSHFFGFFSTFNPDAIKDVQLFKGGYPAEFGGRLGSVLNIYNKDGNRNEINGVVSLGMLSSRAMIGGPYQRGSYMLAIRRSTIEPLLAALRGRVDTVPDGFYFYDINGKINADLNADNKISLAFYGGQDNVDFPFGDDLEFNLVYGNRTLSSTWTSIRSDRLFTSLTATASQYFNTPRFSFGGTEFTRDNYIWDYSLKSDAEWILNSTHAVKAGFWLGNMRLELNDTFDGRPSLQSLLETRYITTFIQHTYKPARTISATYGLRTNYFSKGDFLRAEPRFQLEYTPDPSLRLQLAYGRYYQFLTLITNEAFSGFDVWLTTDRDVPPAWGDQFVAGAKVYPAQGYNIEAEVYYRTMQDLFELDPRAADATGTEYAALFRFGRGYAYGFELLLEKTTGRLNGFIGYNWSLTRRQFDGFNANRFYPPKYDRTHDVNLVVNYRLSPRWKSTLVFSYATGQAYTRVLGRAEVENPFSTTPEQPVLVGKVNASRLPAYHRADISFTREGTFFGLGKSALQLQIINIYSRRNIWFYQFDLEENPAVQSEVPLLPILPTVSYTLYL